jgi:8-oxo-dGTP pyrophosphatase MutT (NUDIX family)
VTETPDPAAETTRTSVGAAGLVVRHDALLMVRQKRATGTRWEVPGGGQEPGETLEQAVARELYEEAGITAVAGPLVCTYSSFRLYRGSIVIGAFYLASERDQMTRPVPQQDEEIIEAAFVDPLSLPEDELGPLSGAVLRRWWPRRHEAEPTFHVELWRTETGYSLR